MPSSSPTGFTASSAEMPFAKEQENLQAKELLVRELSITEILLSALNDVGQHHKKLQKQLYTVFIVSVTFFVIGFFVTVLAIFQFLKSTENLKVATVTAIAGSLVSFIGGLCLRLYEKILSHQQEHHKGLLGTYEVMSAVRLCQEIEDSNRRDAVREKLSYRIVGRKPEKQDEAPQKKSQNKSGRKKARSGKSNDQEEASK